MAYLEKININKIIPNKDNPRTIKDDKFKKLVKSIKEFPEMLEIRPIVVNNDMVVLGGNMRLKACKDAGLKEVFIIKAENLTEEQQKEFVIKDNVGFGEWDWEDLANDWDVNELEDWGLDVPLENKLEDVEEGETIELEKSLQVIPKKEYVLIMADENSVEWDELKSIFKCKRVRSGGCELNSTAEKNMQGIERVFDLKTFKERVGL